MRVCHPGGLLLFVYPILMTQLWLRSNWQNNPGVIVEHISCLFCMTVQVDKSDSWYTTILSVSHCETGGWTCSPCVFIAKTVLNTTSVGVWFTRSNVHLPYRNSVLQVPLGQTLAEHYTCATTSLHFCSHQGHINVTSDLLFSFKALSFYGFWGLSLKSVF